MPSATGPYCHYQGGELHAVICVPEHARQLRVLLHAPEVHANALHGEGAAAERRKENLVKA